MGIRPFISPLQNVIEMINEAITMLTLVIMLIYEVGIGNDHEFKYLEGWLAIGLLGFGFFIQLVNIVCSTIYTIYMKIKLKCK